MMSEALMALNNSTLYPLMTVCNMSMSSYLYDVSLKLTSKAKIISEEQLV